MTPGRANPASGTERQEQLEGNERPLTEDGTIPGTVRYMAPEQIAAPTWMRDAICSRSARSSSRC